MCLDLLASAREKRKNKTKDEKKIITNKPISLKREKRNQNIQQNKNKQKKKK